VLRLIATTLDQGYSINSGCHLSHRSLSALISAITIAPGKMDEALQRDK
jgi:hypothetical protein